MYKLYEMTDSGNCYKVRLILHKLGIPWQSVPTDILQGDTETPEFLAVNPNGKVPVLVLPDGRPLAESNAILCHLAEGTPLTPADPYERALVWQWLFFEQYSHEPYIATNRFWLHIQNSGEANAERISANHPKGVEALAVMEDRLAKHDWLVGNHYTIADIALYAYTHVAHQGGYNVDAFGGVQRWLDRVPGHERHIAINE